MIWQLEIKSPTLEVQVQLYQYLWLLCDGESLGYWVGFGYSALGWEVAEDADFEAPSAGLGVRG